MVKKQYTVTLDEEIVNQARSVVFGAKLSPILNSLLEAWIFEKGEIEKIVWRVNSSKKKN